VRPIRRPDRLYLAGALLILLVITLLSYQDWEALDRAAQDEQASQTILQQNEDVLSLLKDAETGQRGYLLTRDEKYLEPYNTAVARMPAELSRLRTLAAPYPALRPRVDALEPLVYQKLGELQSTIALRRTQRPKAALVVVETDVGRQTMDKIRQLSAEIEGEIFSELDMATRMRAQQGRRTRFTTAFGAGVLFLFLLFASIDISRATAERDRLIVDLQAANERTVASRDLLQTTLASIGDAVVVTDAAGRVTFLNGIAENLTGWTQSQAELQPLDKIFTIVNEDTRRTVESPVGKALREGAIVGLANHTVLLPRDGPELPIDDSAAPIRNPQGQVVGVVLVFRDVTERRRAEDDLRRLNRALLRTNEDLQQFSYAASHDLKEPLRTVTNYLQLLQVRFTGRVLDQEAGQLIDVAVSGAKRMHALVEALLEYSRAGEVAESTLEPVPVARVVEDALTNLQSAISEAGADISLGSLPVVTANPLHLSQVFQNLIGNALKYRSEQAPRISVTSFERGREWVFTVEDNGIGIPQQYQAQLFGIFKRLHGSEYPGTGIGLATCKKIVDRYGGTIWMESEPGKGSRFSFTLPRSAGRPSSEGELSRASADGA
jgi:PAS domain S-box-containing protein